MVAAGGCTGWPGSVGGSLFDGQVGVEVRVGALGVGVAEPESDDGNIDPSGQEIHRRGVPEGVHRDVFIGEVWVCDSCRTEMFGEAVFECVAGEVLSIWAAEHGGSGQGGPFREVGLHYVHGRWCQRGGALAAAFAGAGSVRANTEMDITER